MINDVVVTVLGNIGTEPKTGRTTRTEQHWVNFRLASTPRYFERKDGTWKDAETQWFTIKAFGQLAHRIGQTAKKGIGVIVRGRLITETWAGGEKSAQVIVADAIGVDVVAADVQAEKRTKPQADVDEEQAEMENSGHTMVESTPQQPPEDHEFAMYPGQDEQLHRV